MVQVYFTEMNSNYFKTVLRLLWREKFYAFINISGLTLALTCCLILGLYIRGELAYDHHHVKHDRIFRVTTEFQSVDEATDYATSSYALGPLITPRVPQIESYARLNKLDQPWYISRDRDAAYWQQSFVADSSVFDIFSHEILHGDPESALVGPQSIAVSKSFSNRYFGDSSPIGETVIDEAGQTLVVDLVFADLPENSHLKYDLLLSYNNPAFATETGDALIQQLWRFGDFTYLLMSEGFEPEEFADIEESFVDYAISAGGEAISFRLEPLAKIHYGTDLQWDEPTGNRAFLWALIIVGLLILAVACINYTNLATARSVKRSREVGIQKILGADKGILALRFLLEAFLCVFISALLATVLADLFLSTNIDSDIFGKELSNNLFLEPQLAAGLAVAVVTVTFLAGLYPALYLSAWLPTSAFGSHANDTSKGDYRVRQALVLVQFTISIAVIVGTLLMWNQMQFIANKPLGFEKENRLVASLRGADLIEQADALKNELLQNPDITGASVHTHFLGQLMESSGSEVENKEGAIEIFFHASMQADHDFLPVMGMKLISGRNFLPTDISDASTMSNSEAYIVNESFVQALGWNEALGKRINDGQVIGVVADFHFGSLHTVLGPYVMRPADTNGFRLIPPAERPFVSRFMTIRISGESVTDTLTYIEDTFSRLDPEHLFEYQFLDTSLSTLYHTEQNLMLLVGIFAGLSIFIAVLGLFGLVSFSTEQRSKEISIRKVLGATVTQVILLLSRNILWIVTAAATIGSLLAYLAIEKWLANFAYQGEIGAAAFVVATGLVAMLAYATTALQSYRIAHANPIHFLRSE